MTAIDDLTRIRHMRYAAQEILQFTNLCAYAIAGVP